MRPLRCAVAVCTLCLWCVGPVAASAGQRGGIGVTADLNRVIDQLEAIVEANQGTPRADKVEDALAKVETARREIDKRPRDEPAALGALEGAVGDLQAAVDSGVLPAPRRTPIMRSITDIARDLANDAIREAERRRGHSRTVVGEARTLLHAGDSLRASGQFKDAVAKYKDALTKARGA